jgi:hypothetical protein
MITISAMIGFCIGIGSFYYIYKKILPSDFKFDNNIPTFSQAQKAIIKKAFCSISGNLENPESYYIYSVTENVNTIEIEMYPLAILRAGSNSKGTSIVTATGESKKFIFNQDFKLIKIE